MVDMIMDFAGDDQPEGSNILDGPKRLMHKLKQLLSTKEKKEKERRQQPFPPPSFLSVCSRITTNASECRDEAAQAAAEAEARRKRDSKKKQKEKERRQQPFPPRV